MKLSLFLLSAVSTAAASAVPVVENVSLVQNSQNNAVEIRYKLSEAPAIVTLDIQTNVTGGVWASIGVDAIVAGVAADSAAFCRVDGAGVQTVRWRPYKAWPGAKGGTLSAGSVRAVVTVWSVELPPDYMAVDLRSGKVRYYPNADFVPGGVLANTAYRQTSLLMRKIPACDVTWTMGSIVEDGRSVNEPARLVTLTNDYYMAVFETTQEQWRQVMGAWPVSESLSHKGSYSFVNSDYRAMRPAQNVSYNDIRTSGSYKTYDVTHEYPNPPHGSSFLGILKSRTGLDFDLPSEAQWEFACRAGNGENFWGNGAVYISNTTSMPGRHLHNGGSTSDYNCDPSHGTAVCGSYAANVWGLYDMHGNVYELCLDWYQASVPKSLGAAPNISLSNPSKCLDGSTGSAKVKRGGAYTHAYYHGRSASRNSDAPGTQYNNIGCRVICPVR